MDLLKIRQRAKEAKALREQEQDAKPSVTTSEKPRASVSSSTETASDSTPKTGSSARQASAMVKAPQRPKSDDPTQTQGPKAEPRASRSVQRAPTPMASASATPVDTAPVTTPARDIEAKPAEPLPAKSTSFGVPLRPPQPAAEHMAPTRRTKSSSTASTPQRSVSSTQPTATASAANHDTASSGKSSPAKSSPSKARAKDDDAAPPVSAKDVNHDPLREFLVRYDKVGDDVVVAEADNESEAYRRYLAFELAGEEYAISIMDVREILSVVSVTPVPRAPDFILGVFSKRGIVMPILDLAAVLKLRKPDARMRRSSRVLVVGYHDNVCGLRVDVLHDAVRLR